MTEAIARSNNAYFASVGEKLGYDKIVQYGQMFGLGEKAGLNIDAEQPGLIAEAPPSDGLGMMTSFGEGFSMTPMELTAIVSAVANGGTLYYLQHPASQAEIDQFVPQVKRQLDIAQWLTDIKPGMMGAVEYGTARRAGFSATEPIFGKTGTCTDNRTPIALGLVWFLQRGCRAQAGGGGSAHLRRSTPSADPSPRAWQARSIRICRTRTTSRKPLRRFRRRP